MVLSGVSSGHMGHGIHGMMVAGLSGFPGSFVTKQ